MATREEHYLNAFTHNNDESSISPRMTKFCVEFKPFLKTFKALKNSDDKLEENYDELVSSAFVQKRKTLQDLMEED